MQQGRQYREPDIVYLSAERLKATQQYPDGADLVMEVVSEGEEARERDFVQKREEYAKAGIPEYWIIDPRQREIHVLALEGDAYVEHGVFNDGQVATSELLKNFTVNVGEVFDVRGGDA